MFFFYSAFREESNIYWAAVLIHLSRDFAEQHDEAISTAVAATLELGDLNERDKLLMQRKISNHGLGLRSMEKNLEFSFLLASCGLSSQSNKRFHILREFFSIP